MTKRQIVIVVWDDARGDAHTEVEEDNLPHRPTIMTTIGWLLREDDKGVSVANEHVADGDATCYRGHTFVPRPMIRSVTPMNLTTPRRSKGEKVSPRSDPAADR